MHERLERIQFVKDQIIPRLDFPTDRVLICGSTADGSKNTRWDKNQPVDIRILSDKLSFCEYPEESIDGIRFIVYTSNYTYDENKIGESLKDYYPRIARIHNEGIIINDLNSQLAKLKSLSQTLLNFPPLLTEEEIMKAKEESRGEVNSALRKLNKYSASQFDQFNKYIGDLIVNLYRYENQWRPRDRYLIEDLGRYSPELRLNWHDLTCGEENSMSNLNKLEKLRSSYRIVTSIIGKSEPPKSILIQPKASQPS
jgi:hypothetical protein